MGAWVNRENAVRPLPGGDASAGLFVNVPGTTELGEELLRCVASSRRTILIVNPLITDHRWIESIIAARVRGVRVKVITELRENRGSAIKYPTRGFEVVDQNVLKKHFMSVRRLAMSRVACRGLRHYAHAKLIVVDGERVIISSANGNPNSLGWGSQPSVEAGIEINDASAVANCFNQLWERCPFRLHLLENDVSLQEYESGQLNACELQNAQGHGGELVWSYPPREKSLRDTLVRLVDQARERITIVALSFYDTDKIAALQTALLGALKRGVHITVIVRPEYFRADQYPDPSTKHLLERGLRLLGVPALHAKGIVVDNSACAIFSANINPFSLESEEDSAHVECGFCDDGKIRMLRSYGRWITAMEGAAVYEFR